MNLEIFRLLFDFGLVILIWLVQLVVYPSFKFYQKGNLLKWHKKYTFGISIVVIPLMFGQLITAVLQVIERRNTFTIGGLILIALVWVITFSQFVPMHTKISQNQIDKKLLHRLVKLNWSRTFIWTVIFLWTFITYL